MKLCVTLEDSCNNNHVDIRKWAEQFSSTCHSCANILILISSNVKYLIAVCSQSEYGMNRREVMLVHQKIPIKLTHPLI